MTSKVKCTHCDTQRTTWCKGRCEFYGTGKVETPKSIPIHKTAGMKTALTRMGKIPRKVICLDDMVIHDSAIIAGATVGVGQGAIQECCRGESWTSGNKRWAWADTIPEERMNPPKEPKKRTYVKASQTPVIHIPSGTKHDSISIAATENHMSISGVYYHLKLKQGHCKEKKFKYAEGEE